MNNYFRYSGILLFAFAIPLPLPLRLIAFMFIIMIVNVLFLANSDKPGAVLKDGILQVFLAFFFIDVLRAVLFPESLISSFKEVKLSFLIVPFLFLLKREELMKIRKKIFVAFALGVTVYIVYAWSYAVYFYTIEYPNYEFSFFDGYAKYLLDYYLPNSTHHVYIGMYMVFVIVVIYCYTIAEKKIRFRPGISLTVFFVFNMFYIASKSMLVLLLVLLVLITVYSYKKNLDHKAFYKMIALLTLFTLSGIAFVWSWLPYAMTSSINNRMPIYQCAVNVALKHFVTGVGFRNIRSSSANCADYHHDLITHNMFLNEFLANGFLGMLLVIFLFIVLFKKAIQQDNLILGCMTILVFCAGFTEDILSRQWGVMFFVFCISLVYLSKLENKKNEIEKIAERTKKP